MSDWAIRFEPVVPGAAIVLAAVAAALCLAWMYRKAAAETTRRLARALLALRIAAAAVIALALLQPMLRTYLWAGEPGVIVFLLDDTESLSIPDAGEEGNPATRAEALKALVGGRRGLAKRLGGTARVHLYAFGDRLRQIEKLDELDAELGRTDLAAALRGLPAAAGGAGARLVAAVLVSDGADTEGGKIDAAVSKLAASGIPVYAIAVGGSEFRDVEVADVSVSRKVRKDTLVSVTARVRSRGMEFEGPGKLPVRLIKIGEREGRAEPDAEAPAPVIAEKQVDLGSGAALVEFEFLPSETGFREYAVEVPVQAGEAVRQNNRREFALTVERRKIRVIYMEGSEYRRADRTLWEHQYLEEALHEDGDIEVTCLLRKKVDAAREAGIYTVEDPVHGFPRTKKGLFEHDVIISSDIDIDFFTKEQLENTLEFVGKRGGGFVMVGGWTAFGAGGYDESIIDKMLPVDMIGRKHEKLVDWEYFPLDVTEEGLRHPIMRLDDDPEKNRAIWKGCPEFRGYNQVQRAKPAATILARHGGDPEKHRGLHGAYVILAVQQYGRGRSMAMATDTTAGWGTRFEEEFGEEGDNRHFKKFWQNAVRWLAEYRLTAPSRLVQLELPSALVGRGEKTRARVTVLDEEYEPATGAEVTMRVTRPDGEEREALLSADPARPGGFVTDLVLNDLGRHTVEVTASLEDAPLGTDKVAVSVRPSAREFERPEANPRLLRRIAERTGGRFYRPEEADRITEDIGDVVASVRKHEDEPLWDSWVVWAALVGLLSVEWLVRKRAGLP